LPAKRRLIAPAVAASVCDIFRNEIDKMVTKFRKTNPDFYNGYFAAQVRFNRRSLARRPETNAASAAESRN